MGDFTTDLAPLWNIVYDEHCPSGETLRQSRQLSSQSYLGVINILLSRYHNSSMFVGKIHSVIKL